VTSSAALVRLLQYQHLRVFTTSDLSTLSGLAGPAAAQALRRLAREELVVRIKRGLWMNHLAPDMNPCEAVPYLRAPWPAYVSLHSALADQGVIEDIPQVVYGVSAAIPKRYQTPAGAFHIHHLPERLMWGYDMKRIGQASYPMADPEKAFLDTVYLSLIPRSPIEMPRKRGRRWNLDRRKLRDYAGRFGFEPLSDYVRRNDF